GFIDEFYRRDTNWASRPVHQRDRFRQQIVNTVLHDGVRLSAANLHDRPRASHGPGNLCRVVPGGCGIAILLDVLHASPAASSSSTSPICLRISKVRSASASSRTLIANPT